MHGRGVLFPEPGLNLTVYKKKKIYRFASGYSRAPLDAMRIAGGNWTTGAIPQLDQIILDQFKSENEPMLFSPELSFTDVLQISRGNWSCPLPDPLPSSTPPTLHYIHPFKHTFAEETMQGTNLLIGSNLGFRVLLKDSSTQQVAGIELGTFWDQSMFKDSF